jgi:Ca2+-transporting ATPase
MSIAELRRPDGAALRLDRSAGDALAAPLADLVRFGLLASAREPFDPMDRAFHDLAGARPGEALAVADGLSLIHSYPLSPDLLAVTQIWRDRREQVVTVAAKGAPEAIARLCRLSPENFETTRRLVDGMATEGLRVLGIARASHSSGELPDSPTGFDFEFLGLVGLADPLRPSAPVAVAECRSAGIRVVMITGDYPATARAIAREAGLRAADVLTGRDIETLDDAGLRRRLQAIDVFARVMPEQKLRLVEAFKAMGEIVAMTGDGVNDAPSLKAAHIGVAMGGRGTDVAREAADIVLLDDDFSSIVKAVRLGRRIYDNLRKAMSFIIAVHVPIAGLALLPLVFGLPIVFGPIHIAFLEMIIDPVGALAFEAETEESDLMRRPPRQPSEPLLTWPLIGWSVLQGALTFALVAAIYLVALGRGMPEPELRALTFFALVFALVGLILVNRSFSASLLAALRRPNPWLAWILLAVLAILAVAVSVPAIRSLFRFGPLHGDDLALTVGAGLFVLAMLEALKVMLRRRLRF